MEKSQELIVQQMTRESDCVTSLVLRREDGGELPLWTPGSHIDVRLPAGVRQYSLCGDPRDRHSWRIAVLREPLGRGGSLHVSDITRVGDRLETAGPRNKFVLQDAPSYVFIAGGVGITPILPMVQAARQLGRPWELHYGGRSLSSMAYAQNLEELGPLVSIWPQDTRGILDLPAIVRRAPGNAAVYCCGPEPLLTAVEKTVASREDLVLHVERFAARPLEVPDHDAATFTVRLARSGLSVQVPHDRSILQSIEEAGIQVPQSCLEGVCGSCETKVLSGKIEHRDSILSPREREASSSMFICVSRAASDEIVLDL